MSPAGSFCSENELEIFFFILALAGSDTTRNALCDGIRAFVANPDQADRYRKDPDVRARAVEEVLRWSTPIIFWVRGARHDVVLGDTPIKKGSCRHDASLSQSRRRHL